MTDDTDETTDALDDQVADSSAAPSGEARSGEDDSSGGIPVQRRELILLAVAVLGIVGTVVFFTKWQSLDDERSDREDVVETSRAFAEALFTFDHTTLNDDFDRIVDFSTGDFADEAVRVFGNEDTRRGLIENLVGSRAETVDIFVQSVDGDRAATFAVVDQKVNNKVFQEPVVDTVRVNISLARDGGEWKVSDVNVVTGPGRALPEVPTAGLSDTEE